MTAGTELLDHSRSIAIIGMACRLPGARTVDEFRRNLADGVESITHFSDEELLAAGVEPTLLENPNYVKAAPILEDIGHFDAAFFQYAQRDAEIIDPQHRLFLECAWEALETAGYAQDPAQPDSRSIGVFGGAGSLMGTYLLSDTHVNEQLLGPICSREHIGNDKDHLCTRVSYKLNLSGPSLTVQTACSTSLVAVHLACQSLLTGECDIALAGGVTVRVPHHTGYLYQKGEVFSPDGHCRAFDAEGEGTLFGSGAGIVVLKPLTKALADGDAIAAVIRGSAIGNDGGEKMSYWATNHQGQGATIRRALRMADVPAETIGFVEAHGTATHLGDMIELFALRKSFDTHEKGFCAIGSVKTNIGHLDAAAGVAGLIKAVLSLQNKTLYPSLHYSQPNPRVDFANSPFYVNTATSDWAQGAFPRRAAVNSLGIGGTNAHLILEEAPSIGQQSQACLPKRTQHLLTLSAKTDTALNEKISRLVEYLDETPATDWADVCYTTNGGRAHFDYRLALVAATQQDAFQQLLAGELGHAKVGYTPESKKPKVAFLFTGQGSQYVGMGRELYETHPIFRAAIDRCDELLQTHMGESLVAILYPEHNSSTENHGTIAPVKPTLSQTVYTQPALFAVEYALAQLWQSWGIVPEVVMGHSVGEIVAACVADIFSLEDGLKLVAARGRLMQELPQNGMMVAVQATEMLVTELIAHAADRVSLAAVNGPTSVVIAGESKAIQSILLGCESKGIKTKPLDVSHAFHSPLMAPMLPDFTKVVKEVCFSKPTTKFISNRTGALTTDEVMMADYWVDHVAQPVWFAAGVETLMKFKNTAWLEIGPQPILLGMAEQVYDKVAQGKGAQGKGVQKEGDNVRVETPLMLPSIRKRQSDWQQMLSSLGELYVYGATIDWSSFDQPYQRRKVALPTYPFQRQRYWIDPISRNDSVGNDSVGNGTVGDEIVGNETALSSDGSNGFHATTLRDSDQSADIQNAESINTNGNGIFETMPSFRQKLDTTPRQAQPQLVMDHLQMLAAKVLGMRTKEALDLEKSFMALGMDSLMTVELGKALTVTLDYQFRPALIFDYPTLAQLSSYICAHVLDTRLDKAALDKAALDKVVLETAALSLSDAKETLLGQEFLELTPNEIAELDQGEPNEAITDELEALEALLQR
ncbi:MAG: beta-ketoacyl synthase N-terminal-like domain-containing protein [Chloroflexota bacterium]